MTLKLQKIEQQTRAEQTMAEPIRYCKFFLHFTLLLIAIAMMGQGLAFQDECKNGTTEFLFFGGAFVLALSIVSLGFCIKSVHDDGLFGLLSFALSPWSWICSILSLGLLFLVMTIWVRSVIH